MWIMILLEAISAWFEQRCCKLIERERITYKLDFDYIGHIFSRASRGRIVVAKLEWGDPSAPILDVKPFNGFMLFLDI